MKIKIIIPILMLLVLIGTVLAATVVTQDPTGILANNTYQTDSSIDYGIKVTGNQTSFKCYLYTNENGSSGSGTYELKVSGYPVTNNTNTTFVTRTLVADATGTQAYNWSVKCNATTDPTGDWTTSGSATQSNFTYGVDATDPIVTIDHPTTNRGWHTAGTVVRIGLTVNDTNAAKCVFGSNLNQSANNTGAYDTTFNTTNYVTNTAFNISQLSASYDWADNNTGAYLWTYTCNDSAGNTATLGSNYTFFVDSTAPSAFDFDTSLFLTSTGYNTLWNATTSTDYTPMVGWNVTTELNFSRYVITFFNGSLGGQSDYNNTLGDRRINVTSKTTLNTTIGTLIGDETYYILITAYDMAGNLVNMTSTGYQIGTDSTNRALSAGWNIIGNTGNDFTLSEIMNWTGATTTSVWNSTHQFKSHVAGGSYGTTAVSAGTPVLIYMAAAGTASDLIWNTTAVAPRSSDNFNITNQTNSRWNLAMNENSSTSYNFDQMDYYLNANNSKATGGNTSHYLNTTYYSFYNNSGAAGAKYISYVCNWSINNDTTFGYGDSIWIYLGRSSVNTLKLNWTAI